MIAKSETPIRLILADDHALLREGLKALLLLEPDMVVAADVSSADDLKAALAAIPADILVLDLRLDRSVVNEVGLFAQQTKVVVLTGSESSADVLTALRLGARAIVQKKSAVKDLVLAIRAVAEGLVWMPPDLQAKLTRQWITARAEQLTPREAEIVRSVAVGLRNAEIAQKLSISDVTVKTHLSNIFQKLGIRDRVGLTLYALRVGLISLPDEV